MYIVYNEYESMYESDRVYIELYIRLVGYNLFICI